MSDEPEYIKIIRQKKVLDDDDVAKYNEYQWKRVFGSSAPKRV